MSGMKLAVWNVLLSEAEKLCREDKNLVVYNDAKQVFFENFDYYENLIFDNFMQRDDPLDRHKIAAIIVCAILRANLVGITAKAEDKHGAYKDENAFLANEKLALSTALSHMLSQLELEFENGDIPYKEMISEYILPRPISCSRSFDEVLCRDFYYAKKHFKLNPLTLANIFFMIEAYTFEVCKIDMDVAKLESQLDRARKNTIIKQP